MNEKRQTNIEKRNNEETQTDIPEICHSYSSINKKEMLSNYLRIEAEYLRKESPQIRTLDMMRKMDSLINSASGLFLPIL